MEAKAANLQGKCYLQSLHLDWSPSDMPKESHTDVIEGLQPHPNMKSLGIWNYQGLRLPFWLGLSSLPNLVEISLDNCNWCEHLSSLRTLRNLKKLNVYGMKSVKFIDNEGVVEGFLSLEELFLRNMPQLKGWSSVKKNDQREVNQLRVLKKLRIEICPKLKRIPVPQSLESLVLWNCSKMDLRSVNNLPKLSALAIFDGNLTEESLQNLPALQFLQLQFPSLTILPLALNRLTTLTRLVFTDCRALVSLPNVLKNLSSLSITGCSHLVSLPDLGSSVVNLSISNCESLENLPHGLKYQTALQNLSIGCPKLQISNVRFQDLISLRSLEISMGPDLTYLPQEIQHATTLLELWIEDCYNLIIIPEWLQGMTRLQTLAIIDCHPDLKRRCKKGNGEDWHKISHIPRLIFDRGHRCPIYDPHYRPFPFSILV